MIPHVLLTVLLILPSMAFAMTGNEWNTHTKAVQVFYIFGVVDGWAQAATIEKQIQEGGSTMAWLVACGTGMTYGQMIAIVEKYMKEHPENWHWQMSAIIFSAAAEMCGQRKPNK